ncbi:MAG: hypothetical protein FWD33_01310 [Alphaproteobacteria bacterium]|nr:hypothetical protein [Alphaproteobacteria bacterium]
MNIEQELEYIDFRINEQGHEVHSRPRVSGDVKAEYYGIMGVDLNQRNAIFSRWCNDAKNPWGFGGGYEAGIDNDKYTGAKAETIFNHLKAAYQAQLVPTI